ncbi:uncharacterized protein LOC144179496 isoform X6 [Haemaphysalis longicornis]
MGQCCIRTGVWESSKPGGRTVWGRRLATGRRMGAKEEQGWQPCPLRVEPRPAQGQHAQGSHSGQPESKVPDFHDFRLRMEQSGTGGGPLTGSSHSKADSQVAKVVRMVQRQLPPGYPERPVKEPEASPAPVVQGTFPGSWLCTSVDISDVGQQWRPASAP